MDFNLENYNELEISSFFKKGNPNNEQKIAQYVSKKYNNFNFLQAINILKSNPTLSPSKNYKVKVKFENFSSFTEFVFNTRKNIHNFFHKIKWTSNHYPESSFSVDFKNSIHITSDIYSTKTSFTEYLNKKLTANEVLIYTFLHELGHSIHADLKNKTNLNFSSNSNLSKNIQNFLNESIPFKDVNSLSTNSYSSNVQKELSKDLSLASHHGMKEGFADLYACMAVSLIYPKQQAENIISAALNGREYADKWNKEFYHSKDSIQKFLTDFKNNNVKFNSFLDIQNYIEKTIANTIITELKEQVNNFSDNEIFINHYFGVLKNKLNPKTNNCNSLNDMINYVNTNYELNFQQRIENEFFTKGFTSSNMSSPNPQISNMNIQEEKEKTYLKIGSLRNKFYLPQPEFIKFKGKI